MLYCETTISWCTKKQTVIALSSYDAKYIAGSFAYCQSIQLDSLLKELRCKKQKHMKLMIENKSAINLVKNLVSHERNRRIETRFHFKGEQVMKNMIEVIHCPNIVSHRRNKYIGIKFHIIRE